MSGEMLQYHVFLAYSSVDQSTAEKLFVLLTRERLFVFMDVKSMSPGDFWDDVLPLAQDRSLITVLLISPHTEKSFYQREEITRAIALARDPLSPHRVVPIYLSESHRQDKVPYGLQRIHSLFATTPQSLRRAAKDVGKLVSRLSQTGVSTPTPPGSVYLPIEAADMLDPRVGLPAMRLVLDGVYKTSGPRGDPATIIFIDVDGMTHINHRFTPKVGDVVIATLENLLALHIEYATVIRVGSDEFVVCILSDLAHASEVAEACLRSIQDFDWNTIGQELRVTCSLGLAELDEYDRNLDSWVIRAIHGSRSAKAVGGNKIRNGPLALDHRVNEIIESLLSD